MNLVLWVKPTLSTQNFTRTVLPFYYVYTCDLICIYTYICIGGGVSYKPTISLFSNHTSRNQFSIRSSRVLRNKKSFCHSGMCVIVQKVLGKLDPSFPKLRELDNPELSTLTRRILCSVFRTRIPSPTGRHEVFTLQTERTEKSSTIHDSVTLSCRDGRFGLHCTHNKYCGTLNSNSDLDYTILSPVNIVCLPFSWGVDIESGSFEELV